MQFVILGNGIAGVSAAYSIRRFNQEAPIMIISREPHPAYSACVLPDYVSGEIGRKSVFIKNFADYSRSNIRLVTSQSAIAIDIGQKSIIFGSRDISYCKLIIATGSKPTVPPIKGIDKPGVFTLKSLEDADRIRRWSGQTAVVVGSGPIGVEASLALKGRGYRVFLVELFDWILPQLFDDYPALIIRDILQRGEIEVSTQEKVVEILGTNTVQAVLTDRRKIKCDTVIIAAGMKPDVELVDGVVAQGKSTGILVDDKMRTNVPDIYACGDCV